ncbi:MAG TPA: ABC transporter permease subunit [Chthoniobacteraceae bacterium]|nr:ABC transporter permease subunit [Chthoniobacteraceae bacterium]
MTAYILRRLLLMVPTMLGITTVCFFLCQMLPGGPVEQQIARIRHAGAMRGASARDVPQEEIELLKKQYGYDKPAYVRYALWLGNVAHFNFGTSLVYHQPVLKVMVSKMPLSLFFGLTSFIISYLVSIPLGVQKALTHGSFSDAVSSAVVSAGYVVPSYALGIILIILFAGGSYLNWFPIGGLVSDDYENLSAMGKALDFLHHMLLPLACYLAGEFAFLVMLMKNSLLDELGRDYMRTALAKGLSFKQAVWRQAFRNSLIPIATGIGAIFSLLFTATLLIEKVFDLDGMGMLVFNSMKACDYSVVMAFITLSSFLIMLGRLFSDIIYVVIDPRIRFD